MKTTSVKKILTISLISLFFVQIIYTVVVEPAVANAVGTSAVDPGGVDVTLTVLSGISISSPGDVALLPTMGVGANSAIGSATWTVTTNHYNGYTLGVHASAAPALVNTTSNSFADYQTVSKIAWSLPASSYQFGFSAFGDTTDTPTATWGSGGCGTSGIPNVGQKYTGFTGVTDIIIATRATVTSTSGMNTTVCFAAGQNGVYAPSGAYKATITATATES